MPLPPIPRRVITALLNPCRWLLATVLLTGAGLGAPLAGQILPGSMVKPPAQDSVVKADTVAAAISQGDIPAAAQRDLSRLRALTRTVDGLDPHADVEQQLPGIQTTIREMQDAVETEGRSRRAIRRFADFRQELMREQATLDRWEGAMLRQSEALAKARDEVIKLRDLWDRTRAASDADTPRAIVQRISQVQDAIAATDAGIRRRLDRVFTLQTNVQNTLADVAVPLATLDQALADEGRSLVVVEAPPLWTALAAHGSGKSFVAGIRGFWQDDARALGRFATTYRTRLIVHLLLTLALIAGMVALNRRVVIPDHETDWLRRSALVLTHPVAAALLVSLSIGFWFYPYAPVVVNDMLMVALLAPLAILVPEFIPAATRRLMLGTAALAALVQLLALSAPTDLAERLVLLAGGTAGLVALRRLLASHPVEVYNPRAREAAMTFSRVGVGLLGTAILSNLVGNVSLAELLTQGTLGSGYLALVLYAAVLVVHAALSILLRTDTARSLRVVRIYPDDIQARLDKFLRLVLIASWALGTLSIFGVLDPLSSFVGQALAEQWTVGSITMTLGGIVGFVFTLWLSVLLARFLSFVLEGEVLPRFALPRGVPSTITMMLRYGVITLGFILAIGATGVELSRFSILAGALGVGVGFGLQNVVNNFVSGLILALERPVQVGDVVQVGEFNGTVKRIGIRSSTIRTFDGAEIILPNANLIANPVTNWTLSSSDRRIEVKVGVAYGTNPEQVLALLVAEAAKNPRVKHDPAPLALFQGFGDSALNFSLRFWTEDFNNWTAVQSEVTVGVNAALAANGIEIPFPQRDLRLRSVDPAVRAALAPEATTEGSLPA